MRTYRADTTGVKPCSYQNQHADLYNGPVEAQMDEIIFVVSGDPDGGYTAQALGESISTEAQDLETLDDMVRDAVLCGTPRSHSR